MNCEQKKKHGNCYFVYRAKNVYENTSHHYPSLHFTSNNDVENTGNDNYELNMWKLAYKHSHTHKTGYSTWMIMKVVCLKFNTNIILSNLMWCDENWTQRQQINDLMSFFRQCCTCSPKRISSHIFSVPLKLKIG